MTKCVDPHAGQLGPWPRLLFDTPIEFTVEEDSKDAFKRASNVVRQVCTILSQPEHGIASPRVSGSWKDQTV